MKSFYLEGVHYRQETVKCNNPRCKSCPHGPYWFGYSRTGAFLKRTYIGKDLPKVVQKYARQEEELDQAAAVVEELVQEPMKLSKAVASRLKRFAEKNGR